MNKNNTSKITHTTEEEIVNQEVFIKKLKSRYADLAKNSLVRVQYSCSGNSCGIDDELQSEED